MKALHTSLVIVVAAIVILIVALIILTIFGVGVTPMRSITDARSQCFTQGSISCQTAGSPPITWNSPSVMVNNVMMSCSLATGCTDCRCILGGGELIGDFEPGEKVYAGDSEGRSIGIELPDNSIKIAMDNVPTEEGGAYA
ncbi:MAG: hypothetical protein KAT35_06105 [Candidatus Aenigmarchaeota archaeon]|nr:hypothetical protein [Candidatus Aenigmarchaeota archaeon]